MRRLIGLGLAALGVYLLVFAPLLATFVAGRAIKYPLNYKVTNQLVGNNVSYFSPSMVKQVTGATLMVTSTLKGEGNGTSSVAVWNEFNYLYDKTNHAVYTYNSRRFAFDRKTAQLVNCCGASLNGNPAIRQTGLVGFLWPMPTLKQNYRIFDETLQKPTLARYTGTATVGGISVYRFVERVSQAKVGTLTVPRSFAGYKGNSNITLPEAYTADNVVYVDPVTGGQIQEVEYQHLALVDATGRDRMLLLNATLKPTPASASAILSLDKNARSEISLVTVILPIASGVLGLAALVAGILLIRSRRGGRHSVADGTVSPTLDPAL
jgi:hypothetical protein